MRDEPSDLFKAIYWPLLLYSWLCAPGMFFEILHPRDLDTPEKTFAFFAFVVVSGPTLIPAGYRVFHLGREWMNEP